MTNTFEMLVCDILYSNDFLVSAVALARNTHDAKDLIQETALKSLRFKDSFVGGNLHGWLFTILRNTFINKTRYHYYHRIVLYENPEQLSPEWSEPEIFKNEASAIVASDVDKLLMGVSRLHKSNKEAIELSLQGYKMHEIAHKVGVPEGTIKSRIFKAKKQLKNDASFR